ncbi:MAG: glycoside hydrolase, partial [Clostridia bacterium]|nr:glycoside hydrolase [Clostridia bacterium]
TWCCPDMVGGGEISSIGPDGKGLDEELFVRWAQANALMGMMQMSAAPWRVLSPEMAALVVDALALHAKLGETFIALARACAESGEPMTRSMEYAYPHCGYERIADQFMLGDDILCAPVIEKGARSRSVVLPEGRWRADDGEVYDGGQTITIDVPLARIPYFTKEN